VFPFTKSNRAGFMDGTMFAFSHRPFERELVSESVHIQLIGVARNSYEYVEHKPRRHSPHVPKPSEVQEYQRENGGISD